MAFIFFYLRIQPLLWVEQQGSQVKSTSHARKVNKWMKYGQSIENEHWGPEQVVWFVVEMVGQSCVWSKGLSGHPDQIPHDQWLFLDGVRCHNKLWESLNRPHQLVGICRRASWCGRHSSRLWRLSVYYVALYSSKIVALNYVQFFWGYMTLCGIFLRVKHCKKR